MFENSGFKYKVVINGNSLEVYENEFNIPYSLKENEVPDVPENRKPQGVLRESKQIKTELIDEETGEIIEETISDRASLELKLEKGLLTPMEYNSRKLDSLRRSRSRAITEVRRKIDNNLYAWGQKPKFITLTYNKQMEDRELAYNDYKQFIKRLNYNLAKNDKDKKRQWLKWVSVIEHQKNGRIHFHSIFFNLPFIKKRDLQEIWGNGIVDIRAVGVENGVRKLIFYLMKYILKEQIEDNKKSVENKMAIADRKKRFYLSSNGLKKQKEILLTADEKYKLDLLIEKYNLEKEYTKKYDSKLNGQVHYTQYYPKK